MIGRVLVGHQTEALASFTVDFSLAPLGMAVTIAPLLMTVGPRRWNCRWR